MAPKYSLGAALKFVRQLRGLSQEAFSDISSRTYLSSLERNLKNPTLSKLDDLCKVLDVHPLALLALAYANTDPREAMQLLVRVQQELDDLEGKKFLTQI